MVKIAAVLDSTCLIGLERIGHLRLLPALLDPAYAPPAVIAEFGSQPSWLQVEAPTDRGMIAALRLIIDPGESEAVALAYEKGFRIILDDRKAREAAQRLGLQVTGTIGLLLKAKERGIVREICSLLDSLDAQAFHISSQLRTEALRLAGE